MSALSDDNDSQFSFEPISSGYHVNTDYEFVDALGPPVPWEVSTQVKSLSPGKGRCLITNVGHESGVTLTYCLPPRLLHNCKWMGRLEWHWGLRFGDLDTHIRSPYNVFPVSTSLSAIYDFPRMKPSWILVPEDHIVDKFFDGLTEIKQEDPSRLRKYMTLYVASRGRLPQFEEKTFKYRFVPMPCRMQSTILTRQPNTKFAPPNLSEVSIHVHPFEGFPLVVSHLDPKFVIMESGRKMDLVANHLARRDNWLKSDPILDKIYDIFLAWKAPIPFSAFTHCPDYYTPDLDCPDETIGDITNSHRTWPYFSQLVKRKRSEELKELALKQNYKGHAVHLPKLTLSEAADIWTRNKISGWSQDISASEELGACDLSSAPAEETILDEAHSSATKENSHSNRDSVGVHTPPRRLVYDNDCWY